MLRMRALVAVWTDNNYVSCVADLGSDGRDDGLRVDEGGVAEVVEAAIGEDLGTSLEPDRLAKLDACRAHPVSSMHTLAAAGSPRAKNQALRPWDAVSLLDMQTRKLIWRP
jgi:hypothetical protein